MEGVFSGGLGLAAQSFSKPQSLVFVSTQSRTQLPQRSTQWYGCVCSVDKRSVTI